MTHNGGLLTINCRSAKSLFDHYVKRRSNALSQRAASESNQAMTSRVWRTHIELFMLSSVRELLEQLDRLKLDRAHSHLRYWFRGQPKTGLPLQPGVYRPAFGFHAKEEDRFDKEKHLSQDFRVLSAGLRTGRETDVDIYFLQQHYLMPTRLLDWTSNPLAALYFACDGDESADGELFLVDAYNLTPKGIATSRREEFINAIKAIVEWKRPSELPSSIMAVRPDHFDRRIALQRSHFTFHVPNKPILKETATNELKSFKVSQGRKGAILKELSLLGINHFSVFGDLEHLARYLTDAYR
jgi:hypothetical protein